MSGSAPAYDIPGLNLSESDGITVWYDPQNYAFDDGDLLTENDHYYMDWAEGKLYLFAATIAKPKALKVEYTAGWTPPGSGDDTLETVADPPLVLACLYQTAFLHRRARSDNVGLGVDRSLVSDRTSIQGAIWNTNMGLCKEALGQLRPYKPVIIGRG